MLLSQGFIHVIAQGHTEYPDIPTLQILTSDEMFNMGGFWNTYVFLTDGVYYLGAIFRHRIDVRHEWLDDFAVIGIREWTIGHDPEDARNFLVFTDYYTVAFPQQLLGDEVMLAPEHSI